MRITYNTPRYCTFGSMQPGEMFRSEDSKGMYIKIAPMHHTGCVHNTANSICIDPSSSTGDVGAGEATFWDNDDRVIPVRSIVVDFEELK